jgi:hypothetical protein
VIALRASGIAKLEDAMIDNPVLDVQRTGDELWGLIDSLAIVDNISKIVPCTKALHHLLPDWLSLWIGSTRKHFSDFTIRNFRVNTEGNDQCLPIFSRRSRELRGRQQ